MYTLFSFATGLIFGAGLLLAGMANPVKVLGFLDITGRWDPSLALVMAGAVAVSAMAFAVARGRSTSLLGTPVQMPTARGLDRRLVAGSLVFGIGWGLVGFCPGPALVGVGAGVVKAAGFVAAMLVGMALFESAEKLMQTRREAAAHV